MKDVLITVLNSWQTFYNFWHSLKKSEKKERNARGEMQKKQPRDKDEKRNG